MTDIARDIEPDAWFGVHPDDESIDPMQTLIDTSQELGLYDDSPPVFHLRQYGDVTAAQLDEAIAQPEQLAISEFTIADLAMKHLGSYAEKDYDFAVAVISASKVAQPEQPRADFTTGQEFVTFAQPEQIAPQPTTQAVQEPTEAMIRAGCLSQQATPEYDNYEDWANSYSGGTVECIRGFLRKDYLAMLAAIAQPEQPAPVRQPMTDIALFDIADDFKSQYMHAGTTFDEFDCIGFARAIEAAHGIAQPKDKS